MKIINIVVLLFSCIIDIYLLYTFFENFMDKRDSFGNSKIKSFIGSMITVLLIFGVNLLGNGDINLFVVPIIYWLYILGLFEGKRTTRVLSFIVAYTIICGGEGIYALLVGLSNNAYKNMSNIALDVLAVKLITYILFIVMEQIAGTKNTKMSSKIFLKYLIIPISGFGMMMGIFYSGLDVSSSAKLQVLMTGCFLFMVIGNIMVFYAFQQYSAEIEQNMEQKMMILRQQADLEYYKQVKENQKRHREFVHNTNHYLGSIFQLAKEQNYEAILSVVGQLQEQMEENESVLYSNHPVLNAILVEKGNIAKKEGVEYKVNIEAGCKLNCVDDADLIAMLGNLLDNAIRAAKNCEKRKFIDTCIFMQDAGGYCVIKIKNGYSGTLLQNNGQFFTTKKDKKMHGIGLKSVSRMAEKYNGFLEYGEKEQGIFEADLFLSVYDQ